MAPTTSDIDRDVDEFLSTLNAMGLRERHEFLGDIFAQARPSAVREFLRQYRVNVDPVQARARVSEFLTSVRRQASDAALPEATREDARWLLTTYSDMLES
jgi:hypothetical protein